MDNENVISLTGDIDKLNLDMIDWQSMTFNQRKRSDDCCIAKYGRTNIDLYELLKSNIETSSDNIHQEGAIKLDKHSSDIDIKYRKLEKSHQLEHDFGFVIINPWILDNSPDYTIEDLENKYNRFLTAPDDIRDNSNHNSIELWGYDVINMYNIMKNKILTLDDAKKEIEDPEFHLPTSDNQLSEFVNFVKEESKDSDLLHKKLRVLDCMSYNGSLYEEAVLERLSNDIEKSYNDSLDCFSDDIPMITPWLTPDEMESLCDKKVQPFDYIFGNDLKSLNNNIKEAMYKLSIAEGEDRVLRENEVLSLGWNPSVPYTPEAISHARDRQLKWLYDNNMGVYVIDISNYDNEDIEDAHLEAVNPLIALEPIYIVLVKHAGVVSKAIRSFTKSNWSHAGISLDEKLNRIYSFNNVNHEGKPGFSIESIDFYKRSKQPELEVMTFFVEPEVKSSIKDKIKYYLDNKDKTKYSFANIFRIILNKTKDSAYSLSLVCSQFVDNILKLCKIDITGKPSNLVTPADFDRTGFNKIYRVYNGPIEKYKPSVIKRKIKKLLSSSSDPEYLLVKPLTEAVDDIFCKSLDNFFVETKNEKVDMVLSEIRELLCPTAVIVEAKPLPIRFGKSGNLFIDLPSDLEKEYQEAHTLLVSYNESNIEGIKHQLARLFYINSIIEKRIKKMKKGDGEYKQLIDLRARVINDFKKYMKIVQDQEKNFDFEQYMKNSEYYNKTVMVDKHTMKYTGKAISALIKLMSN